MNKQDIINIAVNKIGDGVININDDPNIEFQYKACKLQLLTEHVWTFSKTVVQLALVADIKILDWQYVYRLPVNLGKFWDISPRGKVDMINGYLVSNVNPIQLIYGRNDVDDSNLPSGFSTLLGTFIARNLVMSKKVNANLYNALNMEYEQLLLVEQSKDSQLRGNDYLPVSRYISGR